MEVPKVLRGLAEEKNEQRAMSSQERVGWSQVRAPKVRLAGG